MLGDLLGRAAEARVGWAQSRGWAWPLQSITFASTMPATNATPSTRNGFGPPSPGGFGRVPSCGPDGATVPWPGGRSVGASPLIRALIRLGFMLAQERGVVGERLGQLRLEPAFGGGLVGELLQPVGRLVDELVCLVHLLHRRRLAGDER